jgi:hypothetical protein
MTTLAGRRAYGKRTGPGGFRRALRRSAPTYAILPSEGAVSRPAHGLLCAGPAQGGGLGRRGLAAALYLGRLDRGLRIVRDGLGIRERATAQLAHRGGLPLHRLCDARVHPPRGRDGLVRCELVNGVRH